MSQKEWGNITWYLFHTLAEKVNSERFNEIKDTIIYFIKDTCRNLPCPVCAAHAQTHLKIAKIELIKTKEDLIEFLRQFHNLINSNTGKEIVSKEFVITKYKPAILLNIINKFLQVFSHSYGNFEINSFLRSTQRRVFVRLANNQLKNILLYCY